MATTMVTATETAPTARSFRTWMALIGMVGVVMQIFSFSINPGPPAGSTTAQIIAWGRQHAPLVLAGAWTQGVSSVLIVLFVCALVYLARETSRPLGWITLLASAVLVSVSLVEVSFYIGAVQGGEAGDLTTLSVSLALIKAIQHAYVIAPATALLVPLGLIIVRSRVLPALFGYLALVLGGVLEVLGLVGLFTPLQPVIDSVLGVQELWFLACAITLLLYAPQAHAVERVAGHMA